LWEALFTPLQRLPFLIPIRTYSLQNPRHGPLIWHIFFIDFVKFKQKLSSSHVSDKHVSCYQNSSNLIRVCKLFYTKNSSLRIWKNAEWCVWLDIPPKRPNKLVVLPVVKQTENHHLSKTVYEKKGKQATDQHACLSSVVWIQGP
jgi:hypothetical protein